MKALILVDLQNDFVPGGALPVPEGDQVIPVANRLMRHFEVVVATQDWHPADHKSFAANHPGRSPGEVVEVNGVPQTLWPDHCVQGTPGAEFVAALDVQRIDGVFRKGTAPETDSYSAFFDSRRRPATGLHDFLAGKGVGEVYVLGLATDYCVKFTALDAQRLGWKTHLIEDGCRGVNVRPGDAAEAINEMRRAGVIVIDSGRLAPAE